MRIERLGDLGGAPAVLRAVGRATRRLDLPPPAALTGEWFGARAVIAPSVSIQPVSRDDVFAVPPGGNGPDAASGAVGGGWVGYLSYPDAGADGRPHRIPEAAGGWTDCVLRRDRDGQWWYESLSGSPIAGWLASALAAIPASVNRPTPDCRIDWEPADRAAHRDGVLACLEAIAAGEVYQACVCTQFSGTVVGSPLDFFIDGFGRTSAARAAFVAGGWGAVASLSPELFLRRRGAVVTSSPIKGTLPLDAQPSALRASAKEVAENIMIVDLVRNDLGRVAVTGTVTVPELLVVRRAPGVWHLVSTVSARVPLKQPTSALLDAAFPPASVTGTPKLRARQLISQWEQHRRGIYCGTVGLASPIAGCELNVAIRTVEFDTTGNAVLGVGGGITADSDPAAEWEECLHKAAPIVGQPTTATATRVG
ncbi:aminodeoxychorismate synthase component I [Mycobacterium decipiens]|uniref:aminodeoxychorismate synthase component I n=1 Tax=Mycobacterium decipiens TaxID=1430326 RepID=UPI001A9A1C71|nr:aminodeoxychorismate synthase component I [Mycobacterium decipiens]